MRKLLKIRVEGKYGFIDQHGILAIPPIYTSAGDFQERLSYVIDSAMAFKIIDDNYNFVGSVAEKVWSTSCFSQKLLEITSDSEDGRTGFCDPSGKIVIPLSFENVLPFDRNGAWVSEHSEEALYGRIDRVGKWICPPIFTAVLPFVDDASFSGAKRNEQWIVVNHSGEAAFPFQFAEVRQGAEGLIPVRFVNNDNLMGWLSYNGEIRMPGRYENLGDYFVNNLIAACKNEKWGIVDYKGNWVLEPQFFYIGQPSGGLWPVIPKSGDLFGLMKQDGSMLTYPNFITQPVFHDGIARVWLPSVSSHERACDEFGYIRTDGTLIWSSSSI